MGGHYGKRETLAPGIYQDDYGFTVRVAGKDLGRYPLGTPLDEMRQVQRDARADRTPRPARQGTLAQWFDAYLETFATKERHGVTVDGPRKQNERSLLLHWREAGFDVLAPGAVTPIMIKQQLTRFESQPRPVSDSTPHSKQGQPFTKATVNHLRRVLGAVYTAHNGRTGFNPVRDVPKLTIRYDDPRAIPYEIIDVIFAQMSNLGRAVKGTAKTNGGAGRSTVNKTRLRLRVMAETGLPPTQLGRVLPRDLHLASHSVWGRPRRKGEGVDGTLLALTDDGVAAFKAFRDADCFGKFSARSAAYVWRRAVLKAKARWLETHDNWPLPDNVRAYDLRHSFGTKIHLSAGDLQTTADLLMHASLTTTRRYTKGAVGARMRMAVDRINALDQALKAAATTGLPQHSTKRPKKPRQRGPGGSNPRSGTHGPN